MNSASNGKALVVSFITTLFVACVTAAPAHAAGVLAELRSSAALLPLPSAGEAVPTAPAGGVDVAGGQLWVCDAAQGFAPVVAADSNIDPILALGTVGNLHLPISPTTTPATCGQVAHDASGNAYVTQGVVDTKVTPSVARGILRVPVRSTGALTASAAYIATTAGLDGNQPTAAAIGPDGNLYVAFLKSGNIKRIVGPAIGSTQVVQSVGSTPSGHPGRALAFVGNDLFIGSIDALSVILNATSPSCQGGCNAVALSDGFSGVAHTGLAFDGIDGLYFTMAGNPLILGSSQVWRLSMSTGLYTFVAQGGADRTGSDVSNFAFVASKTNLLMLDAASNLWIGDDTSNATAVGAGRLWTIPAATLASLQGGASVAGTNIQAIFNALHGPWFVSLFSLQTGVTTQFVPTFNADGTFTATLTTSAGVSTDAGVWQLTPPNVVQPFGNPQAHLTLADTQGVVLFSNDILLLNVDRFASETLGTGSLGALGGTVWVKFAP